jgi:alpha-glucosidase
LSWWLQSVGYEVYLPSFSDGDGDGMGDLSGLRSRLQYLAWLGVDLIWVTPFYPSPMKDQGYDVVDYTDVYPRYGTLEDVAGLIDDAHSLGLYVMIDLVPNHTSSEHPWFRASRSSRKSEFRDYYVWRDPAPGGGPPNNWRSQWGGPAWTFDEATDQYWLHLFLPDQPDLNWRSPAVAEEFARILHFWLEQHVDGFRVDVAHGLKKHPGLPNNPPAPTQAFPSQAPTELLRTYDIDQPEVLDVYRSWRAICEPHGAALFGEIALSDPGRVARYVRDDDGLHRAFWLQTLEVSWEVTSLRHVVPDAEAMSHGRFAWVQESHDRSRAPSRFGGGALGRRRSLALATLLMGLPGTPFLYQGEELGLEDVEVPPELVRDPKAIRTGDYGNTRDKSRTPMPWEPGPGLGFTTAQDPWLPFGDHDPARTVTAQQADPTSHLHRFRRLTRLRRSMMDLHTSEPAHWLARGGPLFSYRRGRALVAANCGDTPVTLHPPQGPWKVVFDTHRVLEERTLEKAIGLTEAQAVILLKE